MKNTITKFIKGFFLRPNKSGEIMNKWSKNAEEIKNEIRRKLEEDDILDISLNKVKINIDANLKSYQILDKSNNVLEKKVGETIDDLLFDLTNSCYLEGKFTELKVKLFGR